MVTPPEPTPMVVDSNPAKAMAGAAIRNITMILAGGAAIIGFLGKHDIAGLVAYLQSGGFVPVAGAIATVAAFIYSQWVHLRDRRKLVTVAEAAPDDTAVVK